MAQKSTLAKTALVIRAFQLAFAMLQFALGIVCISYISQKDCAVNIITGIFGMFYYLAVFLPPVVRMLSPAVVLGFEIWLTIWWIVCIGVGAHNFGPLNCSFFIGKYVTGCQVGKALLGLAVSGFVESAITLLFVVTYLIAPSSGSLKDTNVIEVGALSR